MLHSNTLSKITIKAFTDIIIVVVMVLSKLFSHGHMGIIIINLAFLHACRRYKKHACLYTFIAKGSSTNGHCFSLSLFPPPQKKINNNNEKTTTGIVQGHMLLLLLERRRELKEHWWCFHNSH